MLIEGTTVVDRFFERFTTRPARVVVVGQGYVGLPLALQAARSGFDVTGLDVDASRVASIRAGHSPVAEIDDAELRASLHTGRYRASADPDVLRDADVAIISVPTPVTADRQPNLRYVREAAATIAARVPRGALVVLESTSPPGTTRGVALPILAARGTVGEDFYLAFAPERIDPGNQQFRIDNTPKLIAGVTPLCGEIALRFYRAFIQRMELVSSPEVAELAKAVENSFRFINIGFINEVAVLCDRLGVDVWEVIRAASSKPFAFMPHFPGPGVGGACIPVVPHYLAAVANQHGVPTTFIRAADAVNERMPAFVVDKLARLLAERPEPARATDLASARILVLGVAYKPNINDLRESPALPILGLLRQRGAAVVYHDPFVPSLTLPDGGTLASRELTPELLANLDAAVVVTPHAAVDYHLVARHCRLVFDTRNALATLHRSNVIPL